MKNKIDVDLYLEHRLSLWATWHLREKGWPSITLLAIMLQVGSLTPSPARSKVPVGYANDLAEEVNTWVNRMGAQRPQYADAIKAYYIERRHGKNMRQIANDRKISVRTLNNRIQAAKDWLSGRLDASMNDSHFGHENSLETRRAL